MKVVYTVILMVLTPVELNRSRSKKAVESKKGGGKSSPDNYESIMPKSNSKSGRGKSASKSKSRTPQVGSKSDGKGKKRSWGCYVVYLCSQQWI